MKKQKKETKKRTKKKQENKLQVLKITNRKTKTSKNSEQKKILSKKTNKDIKEKYQLSVDEAKVNIAIEKTERGLTYNILIPKIDLGTEALLD